MTITKDNNVYSIIFENQHEGFVLSKADMPSREITIATGDAINGTLDIYGDYRTFETILVFLNMPENNNLELRSKVLKEREFKGNVVTNIFLEKNEEINVFSDKNSSKFWLIQHSGPNNDGILLSCNYSSLGSIYMPFKLISSKIWLKL